MGNFISKVSLCLPLFLWSSIYIIKFAPKFKDFPALTAIFKDFQGLELELKIQGFLRTFKVCANPVNN